MGCYLAVLAGWHMHVVSGYHGNMLPWAPGHQAPWRHSATYLINCNSINGWLYRSGMFPSTQKNLVCTQASQFPLNLQQAL